MVQISVMAQILWLEMKVRWAVRAAWTSHRATADLASTNEHDQHSWNCWARNRHILKSLSGRCTRQFCCDIFIKVIMNCNERDLCVPGCSWEGSLYKPVLPFEIITAACALITLFRATALIVITWQPTTINKWPFGLLSRSSNFQIYSRSHRKTLICTKACELLLMQWSLSSTCMAPTHGISSKN